jgi:hypothetical protein
VTDIEEEAEHGGTADNGGGTNGAANGSLGIGSLKKGF